MMKKLPVFIAAILSFYLLLAGNIAYAASFTADAIGGYGLPHEAFPYNPMADKGLVAVISAASQGNWQEGGMSGEWSVAAAAYGSDISYDGIGSPYLLGYGIEPMAEAMGSVTCSEPWFSPRCVAGSESTAEVKHRVMLRAGVPPELQVGVLAKVNAVPVRLYYDLESSCTKRSDGYTGYADAGFFITKGTTTLFHQHACVSPDLTNAPF